MDLTYPLTLKGWVYFKVVTISGYSYNFSEIGPMDQDSLLIQFSLIPDRALEFTREFTQRA